MQFWIDIKCRRYNKFMLMMIVYYIELSVSRCYHRDVVRLEIKRFVNHLGLYIVTYSIRHI
jgi:hypothetical protein